MGEQAPSLNDQELYSQLHTRIHEAIKRVRRLHDPQAAQTISRVMELQESVLRTVLAARGVDTRELWSLLRELDESTRAMRQAIEGLKEADTAVLSEEEARRALERRTVTISDDYDEPLVTSDEFAKLTGVRTRQTVHNWRVQRRIIGWEGAKRGFVYPTSQLDERGRPLPGLDRVLEIFDDDGFVAWEWLRTPLNATDGEPPLALLRRNELEEVVRLARGHREGSFD